MATELPSLSALEPLAVQQLLETADGDTEFLQEVFNTFIESVADLRPVMDQALRAGDMATLHRAAHQLKGASGYVGAEPLRETFSRLQALAQDDATSGLTMLDSLTQQLDAIAQDAARICGQPRGDESV